MTSRLGRWLAAMALMLSLGLGLTAAPSVLAQDTATEVTQEGQEAVDEAQQEGEEAVDTAQEEVEDAADTAQTEAAQLDDDDDGFDDWGLLGLLGLLGLGGLLRRPERHVVVEDTTTGVVPTVR